MRALAIVALFLAPGCWASHERGLADDGSPPTVEAFVDAYARLRCERVLRCAAPAAVNAWLDAGDADCERYFAYLDGPALRDAAARGVLALEADAAVSCLATLETTCELEDPCPGVLRGTRAIGEPCLSRLDCAPGGRCERGATSCEGTCVALPVLGETCELDGCAPGLACHDGACRSVVREPRSEGEPCVPELRADGAVVDPVCGPELYCTSVCAPYAPLGAPCSPDAWPGCEAGLACLPGIDGAARCAPIEVRTAEGAACDDVAILCDRARRLECTAGTCVRIGGGEGARCAAPFHATDCDPGFVCDVLDEVCRRGARLGEPCGVHQPCAEGACGASGACVASACTG